MKLEYRSESQPGGKLTIKDDDPDGYVEAYLTKWGSVDSYGTTFEKGAFKNSFDTRGAKGIRLIYNHENLAGKVVTVAEDSYGPKVGVQFNLNTTAGKDAYEHVRAKDIECFSFGFNTVKQGFVKNIRSIKEVDLREVGPVVFEANGSALITECRSESFNETFSSSEIIRRGYELIDALKNTVNEIFWTDSLLQSEIIAKTDMAIIDFHTAYMSWLNEYYATYESRGDVLPPRHVESNLQEIMEKYDATEISSNTVLTLDEVRSLKKGDLLNIDSRLKLDAIPVEIKTAHEKQRIGDIEKLCSEFRSSGFSKTEKERFLKLLGVNSRYYDEDEDENIEENSIRDDFDILRKNLFS